MKRLVLQLFFSLLVASLLSPAIAYAADDNVTVTVNVPIILELKVSSNHLYWTSVSPFDDPTVPQLMHGHTTTKHITVDVCANVPWTVAVRGTSDFFKMGSVQSMKPVSDILWRDGGQNDMPLTTSDATVDSGPPLPVPICGSFDLHFTILLHSPCNKLPGGYFDLPGLYDYNSVQITLKSP